MIRSYSTPHASASSAANQAGSFISATMKPALSFTDQVQRMRTHGLVIDDKDEAVRFLSEANYYRIRGYWLTFERDGEILPGTSLSDIHEVYMFDEELRLWLWDAIRPVEIKARTVFAYHMGMACGPLSHENQRYFKYAAAHSKAMQNYKRERERAMKDQVPCVVHNMSKYGNLPLWAAVEIMSMGTVSRLYGNLSNSAQYDTGQTVSNAIATDFGTKSYYLASWLRHLTYIRNLCGHHSRVYNRTMTTQAKLFKADTRYKSAKLFPTIVVLMHIYTKLWPMRWIRLLNEMKNIMKRHPTVSLTPLGFPNDWEDALL